MTEFRSRPGVSLLAGSRVVLLVSRYHERITSALLDGARKACREAGVPAEAIDTIWVPGAFELGVAAAVALEDPRTACVIALGCVVRGETPHFEYVAGETARALADLAVEHATPVGFGLLTCDTLDQALARAGGEAGNKGTEAAEAALAMVDLAAQLRGARAEG